MKFSAKFAGFLQASALALYISLFAIVAQRVQLWAQANNVVLEPATGITLFLLAFIVSALICGSLAFGYPIFLFFSNKKGAAVKTVLWNIAWLLVFLGAFLLSNIIYPYR
jgi:hypothetical protein